MHIYRQLRPHSNVKWTSISALPCYPLLVFSSSYPYVPLLCIFLFSAIVNGNFAATETFCFLLLSITNSFVIFRLHNRQQQQQQTVGGGVWGECPYRQQNGAHSYPAHVRTKFCLRLAAALSSFLFSFFYFLWAEGASCRFVYRLNLRHNAKMFETYWKLTPFPIHPPSSAFLQHFR